MIFQRTRSLTFLLLLFFTGVIYSGGNPGFTYSGPTVVTVPYGSSTASGTYSFSYQNISGLSYPCLVVSLDGDVISSDLCNNPSTPSSFNISFTPGVHTVHFSLLSINPQTLNCYDVLVWQETEINVTCKFKVRVKNIFDGGIIYVDNLVSPKNAPYDRTSYTNDNFQIGAIDQSNGNYQWIWNSSGINNSKWERRTAVGTFSDYSSSRNTTYTVQSNDRNTQLTAYLRKICNVSVQNSFVGLGNGGVIEVNNTQYNSPATGFNVTESNPITCEAIDGVYGQVFNYIHYYFDHWSDGTTFSPKTFNPIAHTVYTAYFKGYPHPYDINFDWDYSVGQPIQFHWTDNPNSNVTQYQIWRKVRHDGVMGIPHLIATVGRGVQSYTDYDYSFTSGYTDDLLWYDVRQYYSVEQTYAQEYYHAVYGEIIIKSDEDKIANAGEITEYDLSCYPNPFNPATRISYQIPEAGNVLIKIYDILGREVKTLLNEFRDVGRYNVSFDASELPSGVYLYLLKSNDFVSVKKMLLTK